jgi:hypothetical protein
MKKISIIGMAMIAIAFTSCKKDRVCECSYSSTEPGWTSENDETTYTDATKRQARTQCFSYSTEYESNGSTYTATQKCELK